jgi:hypothetical protein
VTLLLIGSSHASLDALCAASLQNFRLFQQPARRLEGQVLDESGGSVPATVTLYSDDKVVTMTADGSGEFAFAALPPDTRFVEASSPGFFSDSLPISDSTPKRVSFKLQVGGYGACITVTLAPNIAPPRATYEERSGKVQLTGTVGDLSGALFPHASLTLVKFDLTAARPTWIDMRAALPMRQRHIKDTVVAKETSNEKGEFQFTDLQAGWYLLKAIDGGHSGGSVQFWIARETLTRVSTIYLLPVQPCGFE